MRGYRDPYRQRRRWEALEARPCPTGCPHPMGAHREYQSTWERGDEGLVEVKHPRYRPLLFRCDLCECEIDAAVAS